MNNSSQFLLDSGFWGFFYKILTPVEWLQTWIMKLMHDFLVMLGMNPVGVSWVVSIIFLVLFVQACIFPLFYKQMKSMRKLQALQPKMQRIQNKYKGKKDQASKEAMQREMMKLYQDNDANPAGSCLPLLIQSPVFMAMFYTLSAIPYIASGVREEPLGAFDQATAQQFTQTDVFGIVSVTDNFTSADMGGKVVIGVFVALMCFCLWFTTYFSMKRNTNPEAMVGQAATMQKSMLWLFPIMYIFSGIAMPFAVLVYWLTNNVCNLARTIWQVSAFPTPGSPAAKDKEVRDHKRENERRAKAGLPSLEEEELQKAKEAAEHRDAHGYQRVQPQRKNRNKKK
ncbi:60Kd inner membrane protein [Bifidobacterium goeldii]|uniref:Membrane protein insertase YidC n=1 Tax=Bifidobacterium goeldii TaxID=2306975 RepID=A0A430FH49_9BIFI|nr:membrane protein insertase YidC [Bifidobacterium goeldii]RSX52147.1 60Kd inner membrane protein [Bifidobacterium goeldii]